MLSVDRPDTYTLLDFISYLCEFGFINLFDRRFCVLKTHENASSMVSHVNYASTVSEDYEVFRVLSPYCQGAEKSQEGVQEDRP